MTRPYRPKVALLWINFGPYHFARARALARHVDLCSIQFASTEALYGWSRLDTDLTLRTVCGGVYESTAAWRIAVGLRRELCAASPSVLLIPGYSAPAALAAALWGRLHGCRNILMSDSTALDHPRDRSKEWAKRLLVSNFFDAAIVSGCRAAAYVQRLGIPAGRVAYAYDVIDNDHFAASVEAARKGFTPDSLGLPCPAFLFVGRLAPEKNVAVLLEAFAAYRGAGGSWSLMLVGRGPLDNELRAIAASLGCGEAVRFYGYRHYQSILPFYAFAGALVLPSVSEAWGLVVNEAMASGLPVIVSNRCGCVNDLVEPGRNGFVFDPANPAELAGLMAGIERMDSAVRSRFGRRSREIIANYSLDTWTSSVLALLAD